MPEKIEHFGLAVSQRRGGDNRGFPLVEPSFLREPRVIRDERA